MKSMEELMAFEFAGNSFTSLCTAGVMFLITLTLVYVLKFIVIHRLVHLAKKTKTQADDIILGFVHGIHFPFLVFVALYVALRGLSLPSSVDLVISAAFYLAIVSQVIRLVEALVLFSLSKRFGTKKESKAVSGFFTVFIRCVLWLVGILMVLSNLGVNVNSLIASLGVGGLAISLALQGVLTDLFSSLSIAIDKPFEEGDFIVVGEHKGVVKKIGLKTTRIQALQGEEIVISNTELTTARVDNFKKMEKRRIVFTMTAGYDTPPKKLKQIPAIIEEVCNATDGIDFDRAHFKNMGDFSLDFEVVYYVTSSDYVQYLEAQQNINLALIERFNKEKIDIPFPTQTVEVKK